MSPATDCHGCDICDRCERELEWLRGELASFKDFRGLEFREVRRDDAVVITGAEYLRKSWAALEQPSTAQVFRCHTGCRPYGHGTEALMPTIANEVASAAVVAADRYARISTLASREDFKQALRDLIHVLLVQRDFAVEVAAELEKP